MKINLTVSGTSSPDKQKLVYWLAMSMCKEYDMTSGNTMYFINEGSEFLCKWVKETHHVNVSRWKFIDIGETIAGAGFDFEDGPNLTALLLKVPNGPLSMK